jgi:hypothetical protein
VDPVAFWPRVRENGCDRLQWPPRVRLSCFFASEDALILQAWAAHGFRDEGGKLRQSASQYCTPGVPPSPIAIPLQITRGVVQSVHAQDLLQGIGAFSSEEETRLNSFHAAMYEVIRSLSNEEFDYNARVKAATSDEVYNNQFAAHLTGLIATARLLDDKEKVMAALYEGRGPETVRLHWTKLFNYVLYGVDDRPLLKMTPNTGSDATTSHPAYSTPTVAAGDQ